MGLRVFQGLVDDQVYQYASDIATKGDKPLADRPPLRSRQQPYSTIKDNPERTALELWEDLVNGRPMVFAGESEPWTEELMEYRLDFATQPDAANPDQQKVRYISDPRVEINHRIDADRHPRCIAPRQQNVARRAIYWKRRYNGVEAVLRKRDVKGASRLVPVSMSELPHMGCRFAHYIVTYLSLFFGWKDSPSNWGGGHDAAAAVFGRLPAIRGTHLWARGVRAAPIRR